MRSKLGDEDGIRGYQRAFIAAIIASPQDADGAQFTQYMTMALTQHMKEALPTGGGGNAFADDTASSWLDSSDDVTTNEVVACAAAAVGPTLLLEAAAELEGAGDTWRAAKRFASASFTPELVARGAAVSGAEESPAIEAPANAALVKAIELLAGGEQTTATRTLEVQLRGRMGFRLAFSDPWALRNAVRAGELVDLGVDLKKPKELIALGQTYIWSVVMEPLGLSVAGAGNWLVEEQWRETQRLYKTALSLFTQAFALLPAGEFMKFGAAAAPLFILSMHSNWDGGEGCPENSAWHAAMLPHERFKWIVETYDYSEHHMQVVANFNLDIVAWSCPGHYALLRFGDLGLASTWNRKVLAALQDMGDDADRPDNMWIRVMAA